MNNRLIKSNDAGGGACTNTVDLYNPFPDGGGVALYQLNGDATDVSGNYNGTASNVTYGTGQFGQAGVFNGSSSAIVINDANPLRLTGNYTISVWVKIATQGSLLRIITKDDGLDHSHGYSIYIDSTGNLVWVHNSGSNNNWDTGFNPNENQWYHIVGTFNGSKRVLYVDGSYNSEISTAVNVTGNTDKVIIGSYGASTPQGQYFNGSIDQVRIFNRALRPYEVEALYTEEYCTPTIVPSEHFNTVTYTGDGQATRSFTGVGFQPDLVWIKQRGPSNSDNVLNDSVRGVNKKLASNTTTAETSPSIYGAVSSFDPDGFSVAKGTDNTFNGGFEVNTTYDGATYVAWNFKAGGDAVTNTDGTITSQVSANTEAGFSVVTFTGNGQTGATVGHGLGTAPAVVINKGRANLATYNNWYVWHKDLPSPNTDLLILNNTDAAASDGNYFGGSPTDSTLIFGNDIYGPNVNGTTYVNYVFAEVEGFSNFGSYVGTGASGNTIVTGFEPAFIMIKRTQGAGNWLMFDNKRSTSNPLELNLDANNSEAEENNINYRPSFLENGFSIAGTSGGINASGETYIYMAFAADPTTIEPTLEDSFNTVLYTGDAGNTGNTLSQTVTGVGFQPDLVWGKNRDYANNHILFDSVRSPEKWLSSNNTNAESESIYTQATILSDGFTTGTADALNRPNNDFVAWCWKGAEIPAINSNGSIPSVVSANPAAGFSIVSYTGAVTGANKTIGHGLSTAPAMVIIKDRDWGVPNWFIWHQGLSGGDYYLTFTTAAQTQNSAVFSAAPTSSVVNLGIDSGVGDRVDRYIAYCFAEVAGFSKFGSYVGNGSTNGPTIDLGFEPAFVMIKWTSGSGGNWQMMDDKRGEDIQLYANLSNAEGGLYDAVDFLANGFQLKTDYVEFNGSGQSYIYMAFANQF